MVNLSQLPRDLHKEIFQYLTDTQDLLNLCLTSRSLATEVYPVLYRYMAWRNPATVKLAARTLLKSPVACRLVRSLTLIVDMKVKYFETIINSLGNLQALHIINVRYLRADVNVLPWASLLHIP